MVSKFLKTSFLFGLLFLAASAFTQPVQVSVALAPPYPVHLEDYAQMKGQIIVSLVNTSQTFLQLRLVPSVKGQSGVTATLKPDFRPATPLTLGPLETKVLTGAQLQALNMGLSLENMDIKGVNVQQIIRTETLPEGMYDLCIRAFDFSSNTQLSKDGLGCTMFNITWYDPPVVINPADKANVEPLTPQFLNISWTPAGLGGVTRYRLLMMDMTANGLANPNDAFDMGFPPFFQKEYLITLAYPLSSAEPPLTLGHKYAVRVQAYDPQGNLKFKNEGKSAVTTFIYGGSSGPGGPGGPGDLSNNDPNGGPMFQFSCASDASAPQPADQVLATGIPANAELKIGNFTVKNTQMSFNGSGYTGTGAIKLDFIKTVVKVEFTNIKINAKKEIFGDSKITAVVDAANLYDQALANSEAGTIDLPTATLKSIEQKVSELSRLISKMDGVTEKGLPLGFDNAKGNVALVGMIFKPTGAFLNAVFGTEIPESLSGDYLCFSQKGIGLQPGGFGPEGAALTLAKDINIALSTYSDLKFLKGADTYLSMDCTGFKELSVAGKMVFSRERALPLDAQGQVIADANTKLSADFKVKGASGLSKFIAQTKLSHDFAIPQAKNFVFKRPNNGNQSPDLVLDFSDVESAPGFAAGFPGKGNAWKGVYFKGLTLVLPEPFKKGNQKVSLAVSNLLIDKQGISATFEMNKELLKASEGNLAGLGLGITYLKIKIDESNLSEGSIKGKVLTPISGTPIGYNCTVSAGDDEGANVAFGIEEIPGLDIDMWVAKAEIEEISSITVEKKDGKWGAAIDLTGTLSINLKGNEDDNGGVKKFNLPGLDFEHLKVNTKDGATPTFEIGVLEFDNLNLPQIKLGNFELNLDSIALKSMPGNKYGLGFPLSLCLLGQDNDGEGGQQNNANTIMGETEVLFVGKYDAGKKRFVYDHIECKKIEVKASIGPLLEMDGSLAIYSDDDKYGDGFRGELHAKAEGIKIEINFIAQFGKKGATKYCFIDAMAKFPGIPIPATTMAINGFGGGFWYNMEQAKAPEPRTAAEFVDNMAGEGDVGKSNSEVVYNVSPGILGFKACVAFCMVGSQQVFNGDVTFEMQLDLEDISLDWLKLHGAAYFMQDINDRSGSSAVTMTADILISPEDKLFEGSFKVDISVLGGALTGGGEVELHFQGKGGGEVEWWLKAGKWSESMAQKPWKDKSRINIGINYKLGNLLNVEVKFFAYLMVGNKLPGLPPIPDIIYTNLPALKKGDAGAQQKEIDDKVTSGKGFNLGAGIYAGIDLNVLFFYARCTTLIGFDIVVQQIATECGKYGMDYGINGWYAKGQGYAYLEGEAGLQLDVWFWKGQLKLLEVKTGAILQAELPNPIYLKGDFAIYGEVLGGLITINSDLHFEMGEKCTAGHGYFGDYPMISSVMPEEKTDVDLFTDPSISFNFKNFHTYTLVEGDDQEVIMQVFDDNIKFERKEGNAWKPVPGKIVWNSNGKAVKFVPDGMLENNATYRWKVKALGYEYNNGKLTYGPIAEDTTHQFVTTKTAPDKIAWKNVLSTFPYPRQRFHAANISNSGYVEMSKEPLPSMLQEIFQKAPPTGMKRRVVARVTELSTGNKYETTLEFVNGLFLFDMPYDKMKPQMIYRLDLLRIFEPLQASFDLASSPSGPDVQGIQQHIHQLTLQKTKLTGKSKSEKGQVHKIIGGIYFKTSKYASMESKMYSFSVKKTGAFGQVFDVENGIFGAEDCPVVLLGCGEGFDAYELKGYNLNTDGGYEDPKKVEPPLFTFFSSDPGQWLVDQRKKYFDYLGGSKPGKWDVSNYKPLEKSHLDRWLPQPTMGNDKWPYPSPSYTPEPIYRSTLNANKKMNFFCSPVQYQIEGFGPELHGITWKKEVEDELRQRGFLNGTEGFVKPAPPLSNAEINTAKAQGQQAQQNDDDDGSILDLAGLGGGSGGAGISLNQGLGLAGIAQDKQYFAVVDYRPWLANADWEFIKMIANFYAAQVWENSHPEYLPEVRDCLEGKGRPGKMPKGNYTLNVQSQGSGLRVINYTIK